MYQVYKDNSTTISVFSIFENSIELNKKFEIEFSENSLFHPVKIEPKLYNNYKI